MTGSQVTVLALLGALAAVPLVGCATAPAGKPATKISHDLLALHQSYQEARQRGTDFRSDSPLLRVVDDRVVIDATAADDVDALERDLVSLGLRHPVHAGRVVSGELPIAAIPALDTLPSLGFARPSVTVRRRAVPEGPARP